MNRQNEITYLRSNLHEKYVVKAFLFGSFVIEKETPNDCDIFIVTCLTPSNNDWRIFINEIEVLKNNFFEIFKLPLNATINILDEFAEYSAFKERVFKKPTIDIIR